MWSPINPNFYSDLVRYPAMLACGCAEDPLFDSIKNVLEDVLRRHIEMSWIVPGGAGECPGYHIHGYDIIKDIAPLVKQHIDIDVTGMDAYVAAQNFLDEVGRTPQGDTHSPDEWEGNLSATKEYPHYGIVFVGNQEKLYWKAGPMRGHYHGDHLSFHWWDMAIDHQVSYAPLAAQEHMHNRVSFSPGDWDYANMGGFERIIAFNGSSTVAHVGISQVENNMLRKMPEFPPVNNQGQYEERTMDEKLTYRRTMVMVKGDVDYFVIRDQNWGADLEAKFCIHTVGNKAEWNDSNQVDFGNMSLYFAKPSGLTFERFDYNHPKDSTIGAFFKTSGQNVEFITVMWPNSSIPSCSAIPGGVQVGSDEIIFADPTSNPSDPVVTVNDSVILYTSDVDLNRSQGYGYLDLGRDKWEGTMYIPEVGYPMGPLPNWLLEQRVPGFEPEQEEYVINITGIVSLGFGIDITPSGGNGSYDYIWSNGETTQDLTSLSAGTYTVTVEDENNCYNIASFDVDSTLVRISPQKQNDDNITIYPIPSKNIIYIKGVDNGNVSIISVQGKVLLNKEIEFKNSHLNISGLPKGTYIIRVENEGKVYSKKIMKE